jgi:aspartyl-tRNA(Asn)/glutamyl-tRNA(Gln) amidotransferase subunit A
VNRATQSGACRLPPSRTAGGHSDPASGALSANDGLDDICLADGSQQRSAIQSGTITRSELLTRQVASARTENTRLRAFSALIATSQAGEHADSIDRRFGRTLRSAVDGLTVSVKGCIPVAGQPWTEGSRAFAGRVAVTTAEPVQRLEAAGAMFIGMTTLSELALYAPDNPFEPMALNPWNSARTPGGSTAGGGVAAAIGAAVLNIGTDSGGSIRNPACHCGVVGFKPTRTRWPLTGVPNYTPSLTTMGVITRSVSDVVAADRVVADGATPLSAHRVAALLVPERLIACYADGCTQALFEATLERLRAHGVRIEPFDEPLWEYAERAAGLVSLTEAATQLDRIDKSLIAPALAQRLARGAAISPEDAATARTTMARFQAAFSRSIPSECAVITPTWPFRAPKIHQTSVVVGRKRLPMDPHRNVFVRAANAADAPAITLPAGCYPGRLPFGVQLMVAHGRDGELLAVARALEHIIGDGSHMRPTGTRVRAPQPRAS